MEPVTATFIGSKREVVASGLPGDAPVSLMPGRYTVKLKGSKGGSKPVTIRDKQTTVVHF